LSGFPAQFGLQVATKISLIGEYRWITDVLLVVHRKLGVAQCAGNRGKAGYADRVEGTIFISSVWKKDNRWSGHRAGSFLVRLKRSPPRTPMSTGTHNDYFAISGGLTSRQEYFLIR
jgi:hypothetical protein